MLSTYNEKTLEIQENCVFCQGDIKDAITHDPQCLLFDRKLKVTAGLSDRNRFSPTEIAFCLPCRSWHSYKWSHFPLWIGYKEVQIRICGTNIQFVWSLCLQLYFANLPLFSLYFLKLIDLIALCVLLCHLN